ncbi:MAG: hypothetical protein HY650_16650 [Acidobacteria bacterium]|nr:hypothetical protein [Acidobacteriota bacterium]
MLINSYFGDFRQAKKTKTSGTVSLNLWKSYVEYSNTLAPALREIAGVLELNVEHDEVWKTRKPDEFGATCTLYWNKQKVQACTVEKEYVADPFTMKRFPAPARKLVNIFDRAYILRELQKE